MGKWSWGKEMALILKKLICLILMRIIGRPFLSDANNGFNVN